MKQIALFSRVSTQKQTLEQQVDELIRIAEREGYPSKKQIIIQEKESARKLAYDERQTIKELEEIIDKVDCVVVYELSRLARRADVMYQVRDLLIENKVQLICMNPYMRLLDEKGNMTQSASLIFSIFTSLAESEMDLKIERMKRGKKYKMKQGGYAGGRVLYGYKVEDDKVVIDEDQAKIVRRIYDMSITRRISARHIARELLDEGLFNQDNYSAACNQVITILNRKDYCGMGGRSQYNYPAIVSEETYNKAREVAKDYICRAKSQSKYVYFGKKLVFDRKSNTMMTGVKMKGWGKYATSVLNEGVKCMGISAELVDSFMWHCVVNHKKRQENVSKVRKQLANEINSYANKVNNANKTVKSIEMKIYRVNERIISGKMIEAIGDKMIEDLNKELKELRSRIHEWVMLINQKNDMLQDVIEGKGLDCSNIVNDSERLKLIQSEVEKVYVDKTAIFDGTIEVIYKSGGSTVLEFKWSPRKKVLKKDGKLFDLPLLNRY